MDDGRELAEFADEEAVADASLGIADDLRVNLATRSAYRRKFS